jgi:hypothetical protein
MSSVDIYMLETPDLKLCTRGGHSVARAHDWCSSCKLPVTNNIQAVYRHMRLTVNSILKDSLKKGDS